MHPIIVAVDGSPASRAALAWAHDHAIAHGLPLEVVTAYLEPFVAHEVTGVAADHLTVAEQNARERARIVIHDVLGRAAVPHRVLLGAIEDVLGEESHRAAMIVVGTRRRGGWLGRFRPSTTNRVTGLATCPVVSIPEGSDPSGRAPVAAGLAA